MAVTSHIPPLYLVDIERHRFDDIRQKPYDFWPRRELGFQPVKIGRNAEVEDLLFQAKFFHREPPVDKRPLASGTT